MENKVTDKPNETSEFKGELTFDEKVIQKIIGISLASVDGLLTINGNFFSNIADKIVNSHDVTAGIHVEMGKKQVAVDLKIITEYGIEISKIYGDIKDIIKKQVKHMTNLEVVEINVKVIDIKTKEQHEKDKVTVQDKLNDASNEVSNFVSEHKDKSKKDKASKETSKGNNKQTETRVE